VNVQSVTILVTSADGVEFAVTTTAPSYDRAYAARTPAAELAKNSDFVQAQSVEDLARPPIVGPLDRRATFRLIQGGKS
jgi:hypothetical protein